MTKSAWISEEAWNGTVTNEEDEEPVNIPTEGTEALPEPVPELPTEQELPVDPETPVEPPAENGTETPEDPIPDPETAEVPPADPQG